MLLITASFTGSDTEIDGAGKIGLAVEENKDPLVFEARDKDSEEALVFIPGTIYGQVFSVSFRVSRLQGLQGLQIRN